MAYFRGGPTNMADCRKDREDTCRNSPASYSCDLTPTPSPAASATPAAESTGASSPATATASGDSSPDCVCPTKLAQTPIVLEVC